ncbi:tubulin polyglutamylase TTLL11 [Aplysia californica]|uniref:Tubulin polyglutamylase TTLL11 n=1 Tax=Aplysia californica TaxID=6500 RepID=A0ABM0K567_APLCA|nr:tubulin polyglutamylase TTLL11 [Aplysia californica]
MSAQTMEASESNGNQSSVAESELIDGLKPVTIDTTHCDDNIDMLRIMMPYMRWKQIHPRPPNQPCDIYWHYDTFFDQTGITSGQVNRFPGSREICQKINLSRWMNLMQSLYPEEYNFMPKTYLLPEQMEEFTKEVNSTKGQAERPVFIVKPSDGHRGIGVYMMMDMDSFTDEADDHYVAQEYATDIFTMDGLKFDLRIHAVIRSISPLEFYICEEGQVRFATVPYTKPTADNLELGFMHLTNLMVNTKNENYVVSNEDNKGSSRLVTSWLAQLRREGKDTEKLWNKIELLVTKTLLAMAPQMLVDYRQAIPDDESGPTCFQIVGFDILLRNDLEPLLLEVNHDPNLRILDAVKTASGEMKKEFSLKSFNIRRRLFRDTMLLVTPPDRYARPRGQPKLFSEKEAEGKTKGPAVEQDVAGDEKSSLIQLLPKRYGDRLQPYRTLERVAEIYNASLSEKGATRMGQTAFNDFARKCELNKAMSESELEKLYRSTEQANSHLNPQGTSGLCFFAFVSACSKMAAAAYPSVPLAAQMSTLAQNCERLLGLPGLKPGSYTNSSSVPER